ncbi:MAG TPA: LCP family protein [Candidatus Methylomirabilis sp.]|nr:LCP family protein [Candidatus Methylomirabilis sp.]
MTGLIKVDFLGGEAERRTRRSTAWIAVGFSVAVGLLAAIGAGASYRAAARGTTVFEEVGNLPVIAEIRRLAWGSTAADDAGTPDNRITFLLLGVGGEGHEGAQLTDTILLASVDLATKKIGIVSLPRDLAFPLGGGRFMKINAVNAYAEQSHPGAGARDTADALSELFTVRIDHVARVDFKGFASFIDAMGGVDIDVDRSFTDNEYPTENYKWKSISFEKGRQHMDGATALQFVRSRHGSNGEGSDFARSARQQKVVLAVKEKLLSKGTFGNPQRIVKLYEAVANNVQTDLSPWNLVKLAPLAQDFSKDDITTTVLTDGPGGELLPSNVEGAFMLFPKKQDWSEIREIVQDPFKTKEERIAGFKPSTDVRVEIKNGTYRNGFAGLVKDRLTAIGYRVDAVGNAGFRGYEKTVIFDFTNGGKPTDLARLKKLLDANVSTTAPSWLSNSSTATNRTVVGEGLRAEHVNATNTDFLIVLGDSSLGIVEP